MTTEIIAPLQADLITRVKAIPEVNEQALNLYNQEEVIKRPERLSLPMVAVIYAGMTGNDDSSRTGGAAEVTFELVLVGAEECVLCLGVDDGTKDRVTYLLDSMREAIAGKLAPKPSSRKWRFRSELPRQVQLGEHEDAIAYVQRWSTVALVQM